MKKLIALLILISLPVSCSAATIGVVTDPHLGKQNKRRTQMASSPEDKLSFFQDALENLQNQADAVIVCGDMTDKRSSKYARMLKDIADRSSLKTIWVKGNNDKKSFDVFHGATYYFQDVADIRVTVLDTNTSKKSWKKQVKFMRQALATDKNVVIAMHQPPYSAGSKKYMGKYKEFRKLLTSNVKYVVSGHWHGSWKRQDGGITYRVVAPLWRKGRYITIEI